MTQNVLPADTTEALELMIEITRRMLIAMQEEARALRIQNEVAMQDVAVLKEKILPYYQKAAEEFAQRAAEFKNGDASLLDQLQAIQTELGAITRENQFHLAS